MPIVGNREESLDCGIKVGTRYPKSRHGTAPAPLPANQFVAAARKIRTGSPGVSLYRGPPRWVTAGQSARGGRRVLGTFRPRKAPSPRKNLSRRGESYSEAGSERIPSSAIFRAFRNPFKKRLFQRFLRGETECVIPTFIPVLPFSGRMKFCKLFEISYL